MTTDWIGPETLGGKSARSVSETTRLSVPAGSTRSSMPPNSTRRNGSDSAISSPATPTVIETGRRMTLCAIRAHAPCSSSAGRAGPRRKRRRNSGRRDSESTFGPSIASRAGSSVSAASIAIRTALIPPKPIERRNTCGKITRPASEIATVTPETATVRPAVAMVRASASSTPSFPRPFRRISSRNRLTMNRP